MVSVPADSNPTELVPTPPSNTSLPGVTGVLGERQVLSASTGEWSGTPPLSFDYQWERCDASGLLCEAIAKAMSATYTLSAGDVGMTVRVGVTASNAGGTSLPARSPPTSLVARSPLLNLEPPAVVGVAEVERSLTATPGRWVTSGPIDFLYCWLRCKDDGSDCGPIPGATSATYGVRLPDVGFRLRVRVTAISDAGSSTRESALTAVVPGPAEVQDFTQSGTSPAPTYSPRRARRSCGRFPACALRGTSRPRARCCNW